jgi:hypothetical protein
MESFETGPEIITKAALRVGEHIFTGSNHVEAMQEADDELGRNWLDEHPTDHEDGFTTSLGRFVNRGEAAEIAGKNSQTNRPYRDGDALDSNHLK